MGVISRLAEVTDSSDDAAFMMITMALVQFMTPGLGFFYAGLVRPSGAGTMMAMSITAMAVVTLLWFIFVFGMAFGPALDPGPIGFIGNPLSFPFFTGMGNSTSTPADPLEESGNTLPGWLFALYQNKFAVISPALASGAVVDRLNLPGWLLFMSLWLILIYAPWCHLIWGGGYYATHEPAVADFAGGIVIHTTSGWSALAAAKFLGPREHPEERPHSVPLVVIGTALLWFGWFGFNGGSAFAANTVAVTAMLNSQVAAASAMVGWGLLHYYSEKKIGLVPLCVGAIAGLATITPGAGFVQPYAALIYGLLASVVCYNCIKVARQVLKVDDALDVWAVHGVGGGLGSILIGLLADGVDCMEKPYPPHCVNPGQVAWGRDQLWIQSQAAVLCAIYSMAMTYLIMLLLNACMEINPEDFSKLDEECTGEPCYDMYDPTPAPIKSKVLEQPLVKDGAAGKKVKKGGFFCCRRNDEVDVLKSHPSFA